MENFSEDTFRKSVKNMDEMPSRSAWNKLEQKLSSHKTEIRLKKVQRLSIAASVLAIVSIAIASAFYINFSSDREQILAEENYHQKVQDFSPSEDIIAGIYDVDKIKSFNHFLKANASGIN